MKKRLILGLVLCALILVSSSVLADATGDKTGGIANVPAKVAGQPTLEEIGAAVGQTRVSLNFVWTLIAGFLVMFMQAGFALAETGFTRAKNAAHTMMMNFMVYALGILGFWVAGFALQMGGSGAAMGASLTVPEGMSKLIGPVIGGNPWGLFGGTGFFLTGVSYDVAAFALFLFQMVFMDTALTIPTGAMAERWKLSAFVDLRPRRVGSHLPGVRLLGVGRRLAVDARQVRRASVTVTSTSPARGSFT